MSKLKDNFREIIFNDYSRNTTSESIQQSIELADEFAIGFADWVRVCKLKQRPYDFDNIKELLEIYKKEKGL